MYYWCIVDMLKIATHVYTTIPTYIKNTIFRNYIVSTMHIKKQTFRHSLTKQVAKLAQMCPVAPSGNLGQNPGQNPSQNPGPGLKPGAAEHPAAPNGTKQY